ncbi:MAG: hypothetical protein ACLFNT_00095 [Spirochaetales bacterium]
MNERTSFLRHRLECLNRRAIHVRRECATSARPAPNARLEWLSV